MIYFIRTDNPGVDRIKIGYTSQDIRNRLSQLNTGSPVKLVVIATMTGNQEREAAIHQRFSHLHIKGEWFKSDPQLLKYIEHNAELCHEAVPPKQLKRSGRKKSKPSLINILGGREAAVSYVLNTIHQHRQSGIPFEVGHHEDKIYVLLEGFVMAEDGTITEPEKVPA